MQNNKFNQVNQANPVKTNTVNTTPEESSNKSWKIGIVVLAVIIIVFFSLSNKKSQAPVVADLTGCEEGNLYNVNTGEPCPETETNISDTLLSSNISANSNSNYALALVEYKDRSILFDANCVAQPKNLEIVLGTRVLVANNSTEKTLESKIQDRVENLRPLHYMLSTSFKTAGEFPVLCGGVSSATIVVK